MQKKFFTLIFAVTILIFSNLAAEAEPLRLAKLPIIFQSNQPNYETCAALETKLGRAVHIPLNGTLKLVDYISTDKSTVALNGIWQKMRSENKKAKLKDAIKPLAEKLDADIIVCPVLRQYSEAQVQHGLKFETHLISNVSATLIFYDRRTDELIEKKTSRYFNDSYNKFGTAAYLAGVCFDNLIKETKLRERINAIK